MSELALRRGRIVSVIAATIVSLACGTNYVYSAWGPQFATRMKLSSTQSNLIGVSGNLGMYASGIPLGLLVDAKGPRPGTLVGSVLLGGGYFGLQRAYDGGEGSIALFWLCLFAFLTGAGGASAFSGAIKTSAMNWPNHRGTATAFPISAFGLSAFFFSLISTFAFPNNTSDFLLLLCIGTFTMSFLPSFALRIIPHHHKYSTLSSGEEGRRSPPNALHRTKSGDSKRSARRISPEPGMQPTSSHIFESWQKAELKNSSSRIEAPEIPNEDTDETSSLMSKASTSVSGEDTEHGAKNDVSSNNPHHLDIRGLTLLSRVEFWELFILLGLLTGIGLMSINNIGNDAQALWTHYDDNVSSGWIQKRQLMHVSILSFLSFCGRLCSGVGSDLIIKKLGMSRFWCIFVSSCIFGIAQICGATIENPNLLFFVSGTTGLAYGFLFGVYPSIVAEAFGVHALSQNWGAMCMAPVISGNIFNLFYGRIYDHHSTLNPDGSRICLDGLRCYSGAYWVTFGASLAGILLSLWCIRQDSVIRAKRRKAEREEEEEEGREA